MFNIRVALALVVVAALSGCGDPREGFVGSYSDTETVTTTVAGSSSTQTQSGTLTLSKSTADSSRLILGGSCHQEATVIDDTTLSLIVPTNCPATSTSSCSSVQLTATSGTATKAGNNITISISGTLTATCSGQTASGTWSNSISGTKL